MSNFSLSSEGPSRGGVFLVYGLYIARFFTGISLLAGVILAYILKGASAGLVRSHLSWLIRLFWYDVAFIIGCAVLFGACFITEPPGSSGPGQLLFLIPIGIFALWNIALLVSLLYGVRSLTQGKGPLPDRFRMLGE